MSRHADLLVRIRAANPAPPDIDLPQEVVDGMPSLAAVIDRRTDMVAHKPETRSTESTSRRPTRRMVVALAAGAAIILAAAIPAALWLGGGAETDVSPSAQTVTTEIEAPVVAAPETTEAAYELVDQYYAAYNDGDVEGALSLLSSMMREVSPATMSYWVEVLGERVDAECTDAPDGSLAIVCQERYTDPLHELSGTYAETVMRYTERNGVLLQNHDSRHFLVPGCQQSRCPGTIVESDDDVQWSYEQIEVGFFSWLEGSHPDVAATIGDASRLGYYAADRSATELAIPFVAEFAASGAAPDATGLQSGPDFTGMTTLEAVEAVYEVINSHDAQAFEAFFGAPPDDPTAWFWAQGRVWTHDCTATEGDADIVRCTIAVEDDFYTRAGAIFEAVEVWTMSGGELFSSIESANSSGYWAYADFEVDYARWMNEHHPDLAGSVFVGLDFKHNAEAATIAVEYLDEFLAASDEYPRSADPRDDWRG